MCSLDHFIDAAKRGGQQIQDLGSKFSAQSKKGKAATIVTGVAIAALLALGIAAAAIYANGGMSGLASTATNIKGSLLTASMQAKTFLAANWKYIAAGSGALLIGGGGYLVGRRLDKSEDSVAISTPTHVDPDDVSRLVEDSDSETDSRNNLGRARLGSESEGEEYNGTISWLRNSGE